MDGWGHGTEKKSDAIQNAKVPFVTSLYTKYPNTTLTTCGESVGLPEGQMGNSEVGHLNLGAGRIVYQELQRINVAIRTGELAKNETLLSAMHYAKRNNKKLHLMGLVSDGGVHSHINHLKALLDICKAQGLEQVYIHAFTDGRDTDPKSGLGFMTELEDYLRQSVGKIASVTGRYYAMDRDKRWERVKLAYDALTKGIGTAAENAVDAIRAAYAENITDEFIKPVIIEENNSPVALIQEGDAVICFNFRTDRCREITEVLTQTDIQEFNMHKLALEYTTMTEYDNTYKHVHVIFRNDNLSHTLGEVLEQHGKTQIRIAETEKYPHVTFFFSGGRETPFEGERRIMVASPKVATYDLQPEMSAFELTDKLEAAILSNQYSAIICNYANCDMVGHTGIMSAAIKAVETLDTCIGRIVKAAQSVGGEVIITADHGNVEMMQDLTNNQPHTQHTTNLVPMLYIGRPATTAASGALSDLSPTLLKMMGLPQPAEMTGHALIQFN